MTKIANLKKVTLLIKAGTTADRMHLTPSTSEFEFIFGIGPGGMCPFEYQLINKTAGDEIGILLKRKELSSLFGHLHPPIMSFFENQEALDLDIKILRIEQPENIEVVKALSEAASHHHGCDCGCGC